MRAMSVALPRRTAVFLLTTTLLLLLVPTAPPARAANDEGAEAQFVALVNRERQRRDLRPLTAVVDLRAIAREHTAAMAAQNRLHHNPNLADDVSNWVLVAENVGYTSGGVDTLHAALMKSAGHRRNILEPSVTEIGVGVVVSGGRIWVTQLFRQPRQAGRSQPISRPAAPDYVDPFRDVTVEHTHAAGIATLVASGVTYGCSERSFCPSSRVTRAQMASFLVRALGLDEGGDTRFRDVSRRDVHAGAIAALADAGITDGCGRRRYCPNEVLSRSQMASLLARALRLDVHAASSVRAFSDVPANSVHNDAIAALSRADITEGCGGGRFCPRHSVTRAQMATFLVKAFDL